MKRQELLLLMASLTCFAGCGIASKHPSSAPSALPTFSSRTSPSFTVPASTRPIHPWRTVHAALMSVTIPSSWTAVSPSSSYGQTTWTFRGLDGEVQLTASSLTSNFFQLLPMVFTPPGTGLHWGPSLYQDQIGLSGSITKEVLCSSGTLYSIDVEGGPAHRILASWRHPSVATVTEAIHLMEKPTVNQGFPDYTKVFANAADGWILAGGEPGAGQEAFYLFQTVDGGKIWSLERYTSPTGCPSQSRSCTFIAGDGWIDMAFWSPKDGIIVNASYEVPQVVIIRTHDGGTTWAALTIPLPACATGGQIQDKGGVLTLTLNQPVGHTPVTLVSADGGASWSNAKHAVASQ
ncbi:MAG: hypothetical protein C7B46_02660 [Sulfobacillus benefaciens]|uniref:Photosynthesis system II assembly factor Ycf48/Hcf136-like domain-containing protein n=1 Tax=Sulfobacillus benefaciens TaxID=453960 RepID=A0A2T2XKR0_9FIRM|nr:MAG: hypothetical protein C7B46_02660 [Sulfobacillus benefaciens]